jgi:hypothetical protein
VEAPRLNFNILNEFAHFPSLPFSLSSNNNTKNNKKRTSTASQNPTSKTLDAHKPRLIPTSPPTFGKSNDDQVQDSYHTITHNKQKGGGAQQGRIKCTVDYDSEKGDASRGVEWSISKDLNNSNDMNNTNYDGDSSRGRLKSDSSDEDSRRQEGDNDYSTDLALGDSNISLGDRDGECIRSKKKKKKKSKKRSGCLY